MKCCPRCKSPDTVSYWDLKQNKTDDAMSSVVYIYKSYYPDARKCVDCEHVWWRDEDEEWKRLHAAIVDSGAKWSE